MDRHPYTMQSFYIYSLHRNKLFSWKEQPLWEDIAHTISSLSARFHGGDVFSIYRYDEHVMPAIDALVAKWDESNKEIRQLKSYFRDFQNGDLFFVVAEWQPDRVHKSAIFALQNSITGQDVIASMRQFDSFFAPLLFNYELHSFGFKNVTEKTGEKNRDKRVCRFCGRSMAEGATFSEDAHAIGDSLGNSLLFCNEECDDCNTRLSKTEQALTAMMDIRRAVFRIKSKHNGIPEIEGDNFCIRKNGKDDVTIYLKEENIPDECKAAVRFEYCLENSKLITNQDFFRSLVKIVIDLIPSEELPHFKNTIAWINRKLVVSKMPDCLFATVPFFSEQPYIDIYINRTPGDGHPYCTAVLFMQDVVYMYVVPEVDADNGVFITNESVESHWQQICSCYPFRWTSQNTTDGTYSNTFAVIHVDLSDSHFQLRPSTNPVFNYATSKYKIQKMKDSEIVFPLISATDVKIERTDIHEAKLICPTTGLKPQNFTFRTGVRLSIFPKDDRIVFGFTNHVYDTNNIQHLFTIVLCVVYHVEELNKHIDIENNQLDGNLAEMLTQMTLHEADKALASELSNTPLQEVKLEKMTDRFLLPECRENFEVIVN